MLADRGRGSGFLRIVGPGLLVWAAQLTLFPLPAGEVLFGLILGLLGALVAVGMALVWRANRVVNFAQADLGVVPATLAADLIRFSGWSWWLGAGIGLMAAPLVGAVVESLIVRRFARAPRLVLTVATIGLSQLLTASALLLPRIWGELPSSAELDSPVRLSFELGTRVFSGDDLLALILAPLALAAVTVWLRSTNVGVAARAAAERGERAALLGVPVGRLQATVWAVAATLSFLGILLRGQMLGLPIATQTSFGTVLVAIAALVLGRMSDLPAVAFSAIALGLLEAGVTRRFSEQPTLIYPIVGLVIVIGLLAQRAGRSRAERDDSSTWQLADEVRSVPAHLARLAEVRAARWGGVSLLTAVAVGLPFALGPGDQFTAAAVIVYGIVALSIVVLTGWAGQVSLGQMTFVGVGAGVGALATSQWGIDLWQALFVSAVAGALTAVIVGLPALRLRGLFLATTTLAFALAGTYFFLNRNTWAGRWIPTGRIPRPPLGGRVDLTSQKAMYWFCLAAGAVCFVAVTGIRRSRVGRVLVATRDNETGVAAYGVSVLRAKLTAFATSGAVAGLAGCLLVHVSQGFDEGSYTPTESLQVFTATVVGGLGSPVGGVLGALTLRAGAWFLPDEWRLLATSVGVLLVLLVLPGGLGGLIFDLRDRWLRRTARAHGLSAPSLGLDEAEPEPGDAPAPDRGANASGPLPPPPATSGEVSAR